MYTVHSTVWYRCVVQFKRIVICTVGYRCVAQYKVIDISTTSNRCVLFGTLEDNCNMYSRVFKCVVQYKIIVICTLLSLYVLHRSTCALCSKVQDN